MPPKAMGERQAERKGRGMKKTAALILALSMVLSLCGCAKKCEECKGSGQVTCSVCGGDHTVDCEACKATGEVRCPECHGTGAEKCADCGGTGKTKCTECGGKHLLSAERCPLCRGTGHGDPIRKTVWDSPSSFHVEIEETNCVKCGGSGRIEQVCPYCDKDGMAACSTCGGSGNDGICPVCEGRKAVTCTECSGSGTVACGNCGEDGLVTCPVCGGSGKTDQ